RILLDGLHFQDELVLRLVSRMLPQAFRLDHHARIAALVEEIHSRYGRAEVADVESALEIARHRRAQEIHDQLRALLADIDARRAVRQVHDDATLAVLAAPEVDVADRVLDIRRARFGEALHL